MTYTKKTLPDRDCDVCGKRFTPHNPRARYCSRECAKIAARRLDKKRRERNPRPVFRKICKFCGKQFETTIARRETCSNYCLRHLKTIQFKAEKARLKELDKRARERRERQERARAKWEESRECPAPPPLTVDRFGLYTFFKDEDDRGRCPLVDSGKKTLDEVLDFHMIDTPSVREVCDLPKRARRRFTAEWIFSEWTAARRYLASKQGEKNE